MASVSECEARFSSRVVDLRGRCHPIASTQASNNEVAMTRLQLRLHACVLTLASFQERKCGFLCTSWRMADHLPRRNKPVARLVTAVKDSGPPCAACVKYLHSCPQQLDALTRVDIAATSTFGAWVQAALQALLSQNSSDRVTTRSTDVSSPRFGSLRLRLI